MYKQTKRIAQISTVLCGFFGNCYIDKTKSIVNKAVLVPFRNPESKHEIDFKDINKLIINYIESNNVDFYNDGGRVCLGVNYNDKTKIATLRMYSVFNYNQHDLINRFENIRGVERIVL